MATDAPMVRHFSVMLISLFFGRKMIYTTAVYIASTAIVTFGFFMNLMVITLLCCKIS
jgi:hypothetical protein